MLPAMARKTEAVAFTQLPVRRETLPAAPFSLDGVVTDSGPEDEAVPGGVYLCQVNEYVSCGACCGLYNIRHLSRDRLFAMLLHRTERFAGLPREMDPILHFKRRIEALEGNGNRPFDRFHSCPFVGFIGRTGFKVGCLLHPLADGNEGVDYRGLSFYGGYACGTYFCPTYREMPAGIKRLLMACVDDGYLYGLLITEWKLIRAIFSELAGRLERSVSVESVTGNSNAMTALRRLLSVKIDWAYRCPDARSPVHYFFKEKAFQRPPVDYQRTGRRGSRYDPIFRELESVFDSPGRLRSAESRLELLFDAVIDAWDN